MSKTAKSALLIPAHKLSQDLYSELMRVKIDTGATLPEIATAAMDIGLKTKEFKKQIASWQKKN